MHILRNSNFGKVFVDTECQQFSHSSYYKPFGNEFVDLRYGPKELFCSYEKYKNYFKVFIDMDDYKVLDTFTSENNNYDSSDMIIIQIYNNSFYNGKIKLLKNNTKYSLIHTLNNAANSCNIDNYKNIEINFYNAIANRKFDNVSTFFKVNYNEEELDKIVEISKKIVDLVKCYDSFEKTIKSKKYNINKMLTDITK